MLKNWVFRIDQMISPHTCYAKRFLRRLACVLPPGFALSFPVLIPLVVVIRTLWPLGPTPPDLVLLKPRRSEPRSGLQGPGLGSVPALSSLSHFGRRPSAGRCVFVSFPAKIFLANPAFLVALIVSVVSKQLDEHSAYLFDQSFSQQNLKFFPPTVLPHPTWFYPSPPLCRGRVPLRKVGSLRY